MILTLIRWFLRTLINIIFFAVLVSSFYYAEKILELVESTGHDMRPSFWTYLKYRDKSDFFYMALALAMGVAVLYFVDWFRDGVLEFRRKLLGPDEPEEKKDEAPEESKKAPPKKPRLTFWEKVVLVLAAFCAALLLGAYPNALEYLHRLLNTFIV